jgi:hypothetical protein
LARRGAPERICGVRGKGPPEGGPEGSGGFACRYVGLFDLRLANDDFRAVEREISTLYPFMMSSLETSSPVSASTFAYSMRWPVFRLIWLKLIFSESEVAGYKMTGQVTSERRKKPFQLARGANQILQTQQEPGFKTI